MIRFTKLLGFAALLTFAIAAPADNGQIDYDCTFNFLKSNDKLSWGKYMKYEPQVMDENFHCGQRVDKLRDENFAKIKAFVNAEADFATQTDCVIKNLQAFQLGDAYLEKYIYTNDKLMSSLKRQKAISDIEAKIEQKVELAGDLCVPQRKFDDWFDEIYAEDTTTKNESEKDDVAKLQEDYCKRKILIDAKILDQKTYNISLNPKNVSLVNVKCDQIWADTKNEDLSGLKDEFLFGLNSPSKQEIRCVVTAIKNGGFAEIMARAKVVRDLKLKDDQVTAERAAFTRSMTKLFGDIMKCKPL